VSAQARQRLPLIDHPGSLIDGPGNPELRAAIVARGNEEMNVGGFESLRSAVSVIDHPLFGPLRASPRTGNGQPLWEALELLNTPQGQVDLSFAAGPEGPDTTHEAQLKEVLTQSDSLTRAAAPLVFARLSAWLESAPADNLWADLDWQGACLTGRPGEFHLHYSCRSWPDSMVTVRFEGSRPTAVEIVD
jgi:hypothetical protein